MGDTQEIIPACIQVICNRNQVRSPFLAAFLTNHFPSNQFASFGVNVIPKSSYDIRAQTIASSWGFSYNLSESQQIEHIHDERSTILPVDFKTYEWLSSNIESHHLLASFSPVEIKGIDVPQDPINCDFDEMRYELSKLLKFGISQVRGIISISEPGRILSIMPRNESLYPKIFEELSVKSEEKDLVIVDASLKQTNYNLIKSKGMSPYNLFEGPWKSSVYSSAFEVMESEKVLCSIAWRNWIISLSKLGKVIIVTPPLEDSEGQRIPDSYLAAIWSESIWHFD